MFAYACYGGYGIRSWNSGLPDVSTEMVGIAFSQNIMIGCDCTSHVRNNPYVAFKSARFCPGFSGVDP